MGIVISVAAGHLAALLPSKIRKQQAPFPGAQYPHIKLYLRAVLPAAILIGICLGIIMLNGFFVTPCNNQDGILFYLLLPTISALVAAAVGLFCGLVVQSPTGASVAWFGVWTAFAANLLGQLYNTPAVFGYSPFVGYWHGVLYDKNITIPDSLITYRALNIIVICVIIVGIDLLLNRSTLRLQLPPLQWKKKFKLIFFICLISTLVAGSYNGDRLGHRTSDPFIEQQLPIRFAKDTLEIYFAQQIPKSTRKELAKDAQFSLQQLQQFFDIKKLAPIKVYVFFNAQQKKRLMGAGATSVAKPWLHQTYIVADQHPHWTLRHELAHLIAGMFAQGPFNVAGKLNGWIPNPGLIEGVATAATPPQSEMNLHQDAKAMKDLSILPPIQNLMGLKFFSLFSRSAYGASGSFCLFIKQTYGTNALKRIYAGESFFEVTKHYVSTLEQKWHQYLDTIELNDNQKNWVSFKFDRPSIIATQCVHEVDRLNHIASSYANSQDAKKYLQTLELAHQRSNYSSATQLTLLVGKANCGKTQNVLSLGTSMLNQSPGKAVEIRIQELMLDVKVQTVPLAKLAIQYYRLSQTAASVDTFRRLYIKSHLAKLQPNNAQKILQALSIHSPIASSTESCAMIYYLTQATQQFPQDSICAYLLSRYLFQNKMYKDAAIYMKKSLRNNLKQHSPKFLHQAYLTYGRSLIQLQQFTSAEQQFEQLLKNAPHEGGIQSLASDWIDRVTWYKKMIH